MKIYFIFGTKAELIKTAGILQEMRRRKIKFYIIHTGQHVGIEKELKDFDLPLPNYRITRRRKNLSTVPEMILWLLKAFFNSVKQKVPKKGDLVLVHGDTESTLLATIIAKLRGCKLAHIEGGLRSGDLTNPFPEEAIRRIADNLSDYIFVPNNWAASNISKKRKSAVINTYLNTSYDSIHCILSKKTTVELPKGKYVVILLHRKENLYVKENFNKAVKIIREIIKRHKAIFILAKNTESSLKKKGLYAKLAKNKNVIFKNYYDFKDFVHIIKNAEFIATDGGSLQEETYLLNKPIMLLREKTERMEGLGETACLTKLDLRKAIYFLEDYKNFTRKMVIKKISPSKIVCDKIENIIK